MIYILFKIIQLKLILKHTEIDIFLILLLLIVLFDARLCVGHSQTKMLEQSSLFGNKKKKIIIIHSCTNNRAISNSCTPFNKLRIVSGLPGSIPLPFSLYRASAGKAFLNERNSVVNTCKLVPS
jgi:hypothetical protein